MFTIARNNPARHKYKFNINKIIANLHKDACKYTFDVRYSVN